MSVQKERVLSLAEDYGGLISASIVRENSIPNYVLSRLIKTGEIIKIDKGIYAMPNAWEDEYFCFQQKLKKGIFSHDTALYLHGLCDRVPLSYMMTFPYGYNHSQFKNNLQLRVKHATKDIYNLGIIELKTPFGYTVKVYNKERTICDMIRNRKEQDIALITQGIKEYVKCKDRDINKLLHYAKLLKVDKVISTYLEVLL